MFVISLLYEVCFPRVYTHGNKLAFAPLSSDQTHIWLKADSQVEAQGRNKSEGTSGHNINGDAMAALSGDNEC